jgi:putative transcriptional regulator
MSSAFSSIKQGLEEALTFSKGNESKVVIHEFTSVDVKDLRAKVGMSQNEFASAFGISVATLHLGKEVIAHRRGQRWFY